MKESGRRYSSRADSNAPGRTARDRGKIYPQAWKLHLKTYNGSYGLSMSNRESRKSWVRGKGEGIGRIAGSWSRTRPSILAASRSEEAETAKNRYRVEHEADNHERGAWSVRHDEPVAPAKRITPARYRIFSLRSSFCDDDYDCDDVAIPCFPCFPWRISVAGEEANPLKRMTFETSNVERKI